ncbi:MAG: hypothetical protein D6706_02680 [Chloroflexi bacterium]|nr:MAG: hypothetical protein D6706_02680 [Chloroflexota bacterium]
MVTRRAEWAGVLLFSLLLGGLVVMAGALLAGGDGAETAVFPRTTLFDPTPIPVATASNATLSLDLAPTRANTLPQLQPASSQKVDITDVLLLYDSAAPQPFDTNFCRIATYYGLLCRRVDVSQVELTDDLLRDRAGDYFRLIGISSNTLRPANFDSAELSLLRQAVVYGGVGVFVSKLTRWSNLSSVQELTEDGITAVISPEDSQREWYVTTAMPQITREFTDQHIEFDRPIRQADFALVAKTADSFIPLITATDNNGQPYTIFAAQPMGQGWIFLDAGMPAESIDEATLTTLYFSQTDFTKIIPLMFAMRYMLGNEVWHRDEDYANLTIDDPPLQNNMSGSLRFMDYRLLLAEMQQHNFHTTIAFIPRYWETSEGGIVSLFKQYPEYFSLVQHGNNADGYEFYRYETDETDQWPARPLFEQEADIKEGLSRLILHQSRTGIPFDRIMVFPWGISPAPTFEVLKQYNYLAVVQGNIKPLDAPGSDRWDYLMYPATFEYAGFPLVRRRPIPDPALYDPLTPVYRLFLDRPVLLNSHVGELFSGGIDSFSPIADQINGLYGDVTWLSLGNIVRRLYLEKQNDDGSVDVWMFSSNHLIVVNESDERRVYHVQKEEPLNVPIKDVVVNGRSFPYTLANGFLRLDVELPPHTTMEIVIRYGRALQDEK